METDVQVECFKQGNGVLIAYLLKALSCPHRFKRFREYLTLHCAKAGQIKLYYFCQKILVYEILFQFFVFFCSRSKAKTLKHVGWWFQRLEHELVSLYFTDKRILLKKNKALKAKRNKRMKASSLCTKYMQGVFFFTDSHQLAHQLQFFDSKIQTPGCAISALYVNYVSEQF